MGRNPEYLGGAECIEYSQQRKEKIPKERVSRFITTRHLDQTTVHKAVFPELVLTDTLSTLSMSIRRGLLNKSCFVLTKGKAGRNVEGQGAGAGTQCLSCVKLGFQTQHCRSQACSCTWHPSTWELEAGTEVQGHPWLLIILKVVSRPEKHVGRWMGLLRY